MKYKISQLDRLRLLKAWGEGSLLGVIDAGYPIALKARNQLGLSDTFCEKLPDMYADLIKRMFADKSGATEFITAFEKLLNSEQ